MSGTARVAAINGFYDFHDVDGEISKAFEHFLDEEIEGPAAPAFVAIDDSGVPPCPNTGQRLAICAFIAFQMTRTPERRAEMLMAEAVRSFLGGRRLTRALMAEYLEGEHLGFPPSENEVDAVFDFVGYQVHTFEPAAQNELLAITHNSALRLIPELDQMHWSIAFDRKERLITADQPVMLWRAPSPRDHFEGVGIKNAHEVRLPLDPGKQLVLRHRPRPACVRLTTEEVRTCNQDMADRCHKFIIGNPSRSAVVDVIDLGARGPVSRFAKGLMFERDESGKFVNTNKEILHTWTERDGRNRRAGRPTRPGQRIGWILAQSRTGPVLGRLVSRPHRAPRPPPSASPVRVADPSVGRRHVLERASSKVQGAAADSVGYLSISDAHVTACYRKR